MSERIPGQEVSCRSGTKLPLLETNPKAGQQLVGLCLYCSNGRCYCYTHFYHSRKTLGASFTNNYTTGIVSASAFEHSNQHLLILDMRLVSSPASRRAWHGIQTLESSWTAVAVSQVRDKRSCSQGFINIHVWVNFFCSSRHAQASDAFLLFGICFQVRGIPFLCSHKHLHTVKSRGEAGKLGPWLCKWLFSTTTFFYAHSLHAENGHTCMFHESQTQPNVWWSTTAALGPMLVW